MTVVVLSLGLWQGDTALLTSKPRLDGYGTDEVRADEEVTTGLPFDHRPSCTDDILDYDRTVLDAGTRLLPSWRKTVGTGEPYALERSPIPLSFAHR